MDSFILQKLNGLLYKDFIVIIEVWENSDALECYAWKLNHHSARIYQIDRGLSCYHSGRLSLCMCTIGSKIHVQILR